MSERGNDDELSYQQLSWALFKESIAQPLVYLPAATGIFAAIIGGVWIAVSAFSFIGSAVSLSYYFLLGKKPRQKLQEKLVKRLEQQEDERKRADMQHRIQLRDNLDDRGRSHLQNLIKLEKLMQNKLDEVGIQGTNRSIAHVAKQVMDEALQSLENRVTYMNMLGQFDIQELQNDLAGAKAKYEREQNLTIRSEYRQTITALTSELKELQQLRTAITKMEQDMIQSQSTLRSTVLLLSQPESTDRESRLNQQVAKLQQEVEIAKRVNEELADFQVGRNKLDL